MKTSVKSTPSVATVVPTVRERRIALILFAAALGLYTRTLAPGLLDGDPGEFQFAAWHFGLAHPTGYPFYLILGGIWQRMLAIFGVDPATALNLFGAVTGAAAVGLLYLLMVRWLPTTGGWSRACAIFTALFFAANPTFWSQNLIAEVYSLHALFIVAFLLTATRGEEAKRRGSEGTADDGRQTTDDAQQNTHHPSHFTHHPSRFTYHGLRITHYVFLLLGLSLTHHRTTLFLLPGVILLLFWMDREWWRQWRVVLGMALGLALPQLLYLYIPLRSGPEASPWLYQPLNGETLVLYEQSLRGFIDFITGSVFAVSFLPLAGALARLPQMANHWWIHFNATGLALMLLGLFILWQRRNWPVILLTVPFVLTLQIFNLFYGIGDIYVFYIPLYLVGAIWAGFGVWAVGEWQGRARRAEGGRGTTDDGGQTTDHQPPTTDAQQTTQYSVLDMHHAPRTTQHASHPALRTMLYAAILLFVLLPLLQFFPVVDQSGNRSAEIMWGGILAAAPPDDAILVSNDRNEIVPLYYLQAVEGRVPGLTGIFPLITPEERFADVGAVVETALTAGERPVYLIKPMDGLEVRFQLEAANDPLVRVAGFVDAAGRQHPLNRPMGPLTLLGYDWQPAGDAAEIVLYWRVEEPIDGNYTTSVQLFDATGERLAQSDLPTGGVYYPTGLWKQGEILREAHMLSLNSAEPTRILASMYRIDPRSGDLTHLAPPVEWSLQ
jgi:hypothetical protein